MVYNTSTNQYQSVIIKEGIAAGQAYSLKLRTLNSLGYSTSYTNETIIITASVPQAVKKVSVQEVPGNVVISWKQSFQDNGYPIAAYDLLIGVAGTYNYQSIRAYCDGASEPIVQNMECSIPLNVLSGSPGYLKPCNPVFFSVIASNAIGNTSRTADLLSNETFVYKTIPPLPTAPLTSGDQSTNTSIQIVLPQLSGASSGCL